MEKKTLTNAEMAQTNDVNHNEVIGLLMEIRQQNADQLSRIDELERTATKRGAVAGAVAGSVTGGVMALGIELLKAKLGM